MENPYAAPRGLIATPVGTQAPLTWKQILFSFEGRIPRRTFWGFSLLMQPLSMVAGFMIGLIFGKDHLIPLLLLYIPIIWTGLALQVKRLHDRDKAGTFIFILLIPIVGAIWLFVESGCLRGTQGANKYGEDPT